MSDARNSMERFRTKVLQVRALSQTPAREAELPTASAQDRWLSLFIDEITQSIEALGDVVEEQEAEIRGVKAHLGLQ